MKTVEEYQKKASEYVSSNIYNSEIDTYGDIPHLMNLAASVMMTRDNFMIGGSFVQAVVKNDLYDAVSRADSTAIRGLKILVLVNRYCQLQDSL